MAMDTIRIRGARTHNLKNVDLDLPRDKLQELAEAAKANCPISRLLSPGAEITLNASLSV